ncbi:MAG: cell division protein FtsZ, partial [Sedimentitalea sp.]|nr:cell division protein FtsZ [Sedimentitalea sp.]
APGTPTPEALRRLQAAVARSDAGTAARPAAVAEHPAHHGAERSRFGINSLINRMTGHAADVPGERAAAPAMRQQPPLQRRDATSYAHDEHEAEQDRIEIPAFLRRQAN